MIFILIIVLLLIFEINSEIIKDLIMYEYRELIFT